MNASLGILTRNQTWKQKHRRPNWSADCVLQSHWRLCQVYRSKTNTSCETEAQRERFLESRGGWAAHKTPLLSLFLFTLTASPSGQHQFKYWNTGQKVDSGGGSKSQTQTHTRMHAHTCERMQESNSKEKKLSGAFFLWLIAQQMQTQCVH